VIMASHGRRPDLSLELDWRQFSAVKIDFFPHDPPLHHVTNDQRAIIQLAMRRAIAAGYRRIGLVMSQWWDRCVDAAWSAGFLAEQQELPSHDRIPILCVPDATRDPAVPRGPLERWLTLQRPEVVIAFGSYVLPRLAELNLTVPRDLAFIDLFLDPTPDRRMAGVRQNCHRVGELAVELLVSQLHQQIHGLPQFPTATLVEGTWFNGASLPLREAVEPVRVTSGTRGLPVPAVRVK
jgi:LacI family transcriptional regulator